jgi:CO/xanthine dehydrogenase Mo-binding subunit/aerobic-type carbon monoxide dehydrogenase small subunit (CoxS/CutS family)
MKETTPPISLTVNGRAVTVNVNPIQRLAYVLRDELGLTGTKIGCDAGDCGACTVLLDDEQVCACLVPVGQTAGRRVVTVEGLAENGSLSALQDSFHRLGAAQCGICTSGMLMAAADLLRRKPDPQPGEVEDALGGVLCRCTGYRKIVEAVLAAKSLGREPDPEKAVGARIAKVDGITRVTGEAIYGADTAPPDALWLRAVRSPHPRARFRFGSFEPLQARYPGLAKVMTATDIPGNNGFGIYPHIKDQPVLAEETVRYRGEAVAALIGDQETVVSIGDEEVPVEWEPLEPLVGIDAALAAGAPLLHPDKPGNVLVKGLVERGDIEAGFEQADVNAEGTFETPFIEHAYIEPEAGCARRIGERIEVTVSTQTPYMDRNEVASVLAVKPEQVRIIPTACGGGFGGKLDVAVQPLIACAAWILDRPVRAVYTRPESMASTTKRHPSRMTARFACKRNGDLAAVRFHGDFNTGAYASWGPTVAGRVPVHATGPYFVPSVKATTRAVYTNEPPAGAFRGFGVPQAAIAHESLMDELAEKCGIDPLEFRLRNAVRVGQETPTGQELKASVGLAQCLEAIQPRWQTARQAAEQFNPGSPVVKRGVGVGCMWYGIGNTAMANPSTIRVGLDRKGKLTLYNGAVDIGQGSSTILTQICADALGVPVSAFHLVVGDTDLTEDAGKTSASRQTFVSGNAAKAAGEELRRKILNLVSTCECATISIEGPRVIVSDGAKEQVIELAELPEEEDGDVLTGKGHFDPPTTPLDQKGQGVPYATYGFAAQMAEVEVDTELGTVKVRKIVAAHDVGRAINPIQVEGQIHGGIAQGIGLALMEEYIPGQSENLHDYLIPTFGDVPEVETIIVEEAEPLGSYGAKGIGEPALIATAPAILNAIHHATGARITRVPATPDRVRAALRKPTK